MRRVAYVLILGVVCGLVGLSFSQMDEKEAETLESARSGASMSEEEEIERARRSSAIDARLSDLSPDTGALAEGRKLYEKGDYPLALERFLVAQRANPDDPRAPLFLGLTHIRLDDPAKATVAWNEYLRNAKDDDPLAEDVRKYMTILLHEANEREAQAALAREGMLADRMTDPGTVAVGPFRNLGSPEYAPLGKSLAAMLIDNLQAIPELRVLEREQVQALVAEADLAEKGLVEASTAVRAGKLLRAGTVAGGSHIDFTRSPTRLKVEAVLVDVDNNRELATSSKENEASRFFEIVPAIATEFVPVLTRKTVQELPPEQQERLTESHTKSLPAAIAFGNALEAKDNKDAVEARRWCDEAEKEDPDFRLARRVCGLIPPVWMSPQAVVAAVEAQVMVAAAAAGAGWTPWVVGGLVVGGAAAGGAVAASSGGGGGGDSGGLVSEGGGNNAPGLNGVPGTVNSPAGRTVSFSVTSNDPDGDQVTLTAPTLPPGATFTQNTGVAVSGIFRWSIQCTQVGQFLSRICATDNGNPPAQRCADTTFNISPCQEPTVPPEPGATPTPDPGPTCEPEGTPCEPGVTDCCSDRCQPIFQTEATECCLPTGEPSCDPQNNKCCDTPCSGGECCFAAGDGGCSNDNECCGAAVCDMTEGNFCCLQDTQPCTDSSECCSFCCSDGSYGNPANECTSDFSGCIGSSF